MPYFKSRTLLKLSLDKLIALLQIVRHGWFDSLKQDHLNKEEFDQRWNSVVCQLQNYLSMYLPTSLSEKFQCDFIQALRAELESLRMSVMLNISQRLRIPSHIWLEKECITKFSVVSLIPTLREINLDTLILSRSNDWGVDYNDKNGLVVMKYIMTHLSKITMLNSLHSESAYWVENEWLDCSDCLNLFCCALRKMQSLEKFSFTFYNSPNLSLVLKELPSKTIVDLNLRDTNVSDQEVPILVNFRMLKSLNIFLTLITVDGAATILAELENLEKISWFNKHSTTSALSYNTTQCTHDTLCHVLYKLVEKKHLPDKMLKLKYWPGEKWFHTKRPYSGMWIMGNPNKYNLNLVKNFCTSLEYIGVDLSALGEDDVKYFWDSLTSYNLRELSVSNSIYNDGITIYLSTFCNKLNTLELKNIAVDTKRLLLSLTHCYNLQKLSLDHVVSTQSIKQKCKSNQNLRLCALETLIIENSDITMEMFNELLKSATRLKVINIQLSNDNLIQFGDKDLNEIMRQNSFQDVEFLVFDFRNELTVISLTNLASIANIRELGKLTSWGNIPQQDLFLMQGNIFFDVDLHL